MIISVQLQFNKAGQGSFYTGYFKQIHTDSRFSVVYDCGTNSMNKEYIRKAIWKFKANLLKDHSNTLDLFMISHFDSDHVNEVKTLLDKLTACDTIVLPYLYPHERLVVYLDQVAKGQQVTGDYIRFLINPVGFLTQFGNVRQIIFISGGDDNNAGIINNPDRPQGPLFRPQDIRDDAPLEGNDKEIKAGRLPEDEFPELQYFKQSFDQVFICQDDCRYFINGVWYFYFYNKRCTEKKLIEAFKKKVAKAFPTFKNVGNDIDELKSLFAKKARLIKLYRDVFKEENLNPTSLVVLHGPYTQRKVEGWRIPRKQHYYFPGRNRMAGFSTLLTGDLYLKGIVWSPYIKAQYEKISVIQIPHHGSSKKWDSKVLNSPMLKYPVHAVINFGLGNTYDHPKPQVVAEVKSLGWKIKLVHELKSFKYHIIIH